MVSLGFAAICFAVQLRLSMNDSDLEAICQSRGADPREQSFELSVGRVKTLDLAVFDRTLVGKHDPIGTASFRLDPRSFTDVATRDILLPLSPRGAVHVRISMEGGEKHDVAYHLSTGSRALSRTAGDMVRDIVDKLCEFIKATLSPAVVLALTKALKDKKKPRGALSEEEVERSLGPVFEYLNENVRMGSSATDCRSAALSTPLFLFLCPPVRLLSCPLPHLPTSPPL